LRIDYLQTFLSVAEKMSFSKAASSLFLSQTAVSFQIKIIEKYYGEKLFERSHHKVVLTEAGRLLQRYALDIVKLHQQTKEGLKSLSNLPQGDCFVGASYAAGNSTLLNQLSRFHKEFPGIKVHIKYQCCPKIIQSITDGDIEIAIITPEYLNKNLKSFPLASEEFVLIASPQCLPSNKDDIELKKLLKIPFVIGEKGCCVRKKIEEFLESKGASLNDLNIVLTVDSFEALKIAVKKGMAASIMPVSGVTEEIKQGTLNVIKFKGFRLAIDRVVVVNKQIPVSHASQAILKFLIPKNLMEKEIGSDFNQISGKGHQVR